MKTVKQSKILIFLLILILLAMPVIAVVKDPKIFDSANPGAFDYANGDYLTITSWTGIDFSNLNYKNPSLNLELIPEKYAKEVDSAKAIKDGKGKQLTTEQIEFDLDRYEEAKELVKYWRDKEANIGEMIIEFLKSEKLKL